MMRRDREDLTQQVEAVETAQDRLVSALLDLTDTATTARRAVQRTKAGNPVELADVVGAFRAVQRAEEAHDLAALDLRTAGGEDA